MEHIPNLPDVTHLCGSSGDRDARAAFEHYRTAWDISVYAPSIDTYWAAIQAYDKLIVLLEGATDGAHSKHQA